MLPKALRLDRQSLAYRLLGSSFHGRAIGVGRRSASLLQDLCLRFDVRQNQKLKLLRFGGRFLI